MSDERDILTNRRTKMEAWKAATGGYPNQFRRDHFAARLHKQCAEQDKAQLEQAGISVAVCGRVMLRRVMGKASFQSL